MGAGGCGGGGGGGGGAAAAVRQCDSAGELDLAFLDVVGLAVSRIVVVVVVVATAVVLVVAEVLRCR